MLRRVSAEHAVDHRRFARDEDAAAPEGGCILDELTVRDNRVGAQDEHPAADIVQWQSLSRAPRHRDTLEHGRRTAPDGEHHVITVVA